MSSLSNININRTIDNGRLRPFHWGVFLLCGLCLLMDGFDLQAIGFVAPAVTREWHVQSGDMRTIFSAALVGVLIGSLLLSALADRIGRRPVLIGATLYFAIFSFLTARVTSPEQLLYIRFLAGIGLGGIMPNAMALVGEYSPARSRVMSMLVVSNGFTLGAAFGGPIAAWMIPHYGWRSVFYLGAIAPLFVFVLEYLFLPESLQFLVLRGADKSKVAKWLRRVEPALECDDSTTFSVTDEKKSGVPLLQLLREGRTAGTTLLWIVNFMNLLNLYFLSTYLPLVLRDSGFANDVAVLSASVLQVGGVIGTLVLSAFIRKFGFNAVLSLSFIIASVSIAAIGQPALPVAIVFLFVFAAGFGVPGSQAGLNAFSATYYPADLRATGVGAGLGIGRIGSILGPYIAGTLLLHHWTAHDLFLAAAVPALLSAVVMFALRWVIAPSGSAVPVKEVLVN
jgi:AAHS family 4-hydroxybenzoate transporter-like MFS transporter